MVAGAVPLEEDGSFSPFTYMPVGIRNVRVLSKIEDFRQPMYVYALRTSQESTPSPERVETNIYLVNGEGDVIVAFEGAPSAAVGPERLGEFVDRYQPLAVSDRLARGAAADRGQQRRRRENLG